MKLIAYIGLILLATIVLFSFGSIVNDFEVNYVETNISKASAMNSSFKENYANRSSFINETFSPLNEKIEDLSSQDGWFDTIGDGLVVLPKVLLSLPGAILKTTTNAITDMRAILIDLGVPPTIILIAIILVTLVGVFYIIEIITKYKV